MPSAADWVFFDIGGTLGDRDAATGGFSAFPSSRRLLADLRHLGLRIGVITTLGSLTNDDARALLESAGLAPFLDMDALVSEHDVNETAKPAAAIYEFAAEKAGVPIERCLYVGESLIEVIGARVAGMQALLKPCPPGRELPS